MVQKRVDQQRLARRPPFVDRHLRNVGVPRNRIDAGGGEARRRHQRIGTLQNGVGGLGRTGATTAGCRRIAVRFNLSLRHVPASPMQRAGAAGYATKASRVPLPEAGGTTTPPALFTPTAPSAFSAAATSAAITS